jgi:hypothetical protein
MAACLLQQGGLNLISALGPIRQGIASTVSAITTACCGPISPTAKAFAVAGYSGSNGSPVRPRRAPNRSTATVRLRASAGVQRSCALMSWDSPRKPSVPATLREFSSANTANCPY